MAVCRASCVLSQLHISQAPGICLLTFSSPLSQVRDGATTSLVFTEQNVCGLGGEPTNRDHASHDLCRGLTPGSSSPHPQISFPVAASVAPRREVMDGSLRNGIIRPSLYQKRVTDQSNGNTLKFLSPCSSTSLNNYINSILVNMETWQVCCFHGRLNWMVVWIILSHWLDLINILICFSNSPKGD